MLRGRPTSVQHFHNPACRHPWAKQISHAAYEDGLRLLDVLRLLKPVAVERRLEAKGIGGIDRLAVGPSDSEWFRKFRPRQWIVRRNTAIEVVTAKPFRDPPGIAIFSSVSAPRYRVPRAIAPLNVCFVHVSSPSPPLIFSIAPHSKLIMSAAW